MKSIKRIVPLFILLASYFAISCKDQKSENTKGEAVEESTENSFSFADLQESFKNPHDNRVLVVVHRGDWRNAPENSLQAIQFSIDMGADMVEIDVQETKDGHLVLMHDETINRTTNGTGTVSQHTLEELKALFLKDGSGVVTAHKIPTLEEALLVAKDKILINLDKSYSIFDKCFEVLEKTGTLEQVVIKGNKTREQVEEEFGEYLDDVFFMPVLNLADTDIQEITDDYLTNLKPVAFEFVIPKDTFQLISSFKEIRQKGSSVWVNSLWPRLNGGHDDEKAVIDPSVYDWYIDNHVDIIQTDRPRLLIEYLKEKGLR